MGTTWLGMAVVSKPVVSVFGVVVDTEAGVACAAGEAGTANLISVNELASVVEKETMLVAF